MSKIEIKPEWMIFKQDKQQIQYYTDMYPPKLAREIENAFIIHSSRLAFFHNLVDLFGMVMQAWYPNEYRIVPDNEQSPTYVTSLFRSTRALRYINDLKSVLCEERLAKVLEEVADASYMQQVDYLAEYLARLEDTHPRLQRYHAKVPGYLKAVFILRVGIDKLCPQSVASG